MKRSDLINKRKRFLYAGALLIPLIGLLFFYNNFITSSDPVLIQLLQDTVKLHNMLKGNYKPTTKDAIRHYLIVTENVISSQIAARNCGDLLRADPALLSANYLVYPNGTRRLPVSVHCADAATLIKIISDPLSD